MNMTTLMINIALLGLVSAIVLVVLMLVPDMPPEAKAGVAGAWFGGIVAWGKDIIGHTQEKEDEN